MTNDALLTIALEAAVPLWIAQLQERGDWDYIQRRAKQCADIVAEKGDVILYRGKKRGESAAAFNALAEGLACLAFAPGGVKAFGMHWQAKLNANSPDD
jgi:hypothetical protein